MSRIPDLGKGYANLPNIINSYQEELILAKDRLAIKGKPYGTAQHEQCTWPNFYDQRKVELKTLVKFFESRVAAVRGRLVKRYNENSNRVLGERMMQSYIDHEEDYLNIHELSLEINELYEQYQAVCDAFTKRGFALRGINDALVHNFTSAII